MDIPIEKPDEKALQNLLDMGFNETECLHALKQANNDVNEAVSFLFDTNLDSTEDAMAEEPQPIPNSEAAVILETFPSNDFKEIKKALDTVNGTIFYRPRENLSRCLKSAIIIAQNQLTEENPECKVFLNETLFKCLDKLLTMAQQSIYAFEMYDNIYELYLDVVKVVAIRLSYLPIPYDLLHCLELVLDKFIVIHQRNRNKSHKVPTEFTYDSIEKFPFGWLVTLMYEFYQNNGFQNLKILFETVDLQPYDLAILLKPFVKGFTLLNPELYTEFFAPGIELIKVFFSELGNEDTKEQTHLNVISNLILITRKIYNFLDPEALLENSEICMTVVLKLLRSTCFSVKGLGLQELFSLIDESRSQQISEINSTRLSNWLISNKILTTLLERNIDQQGYVNRVRGVVEFLYTKLTKEDLEMIWLLQDGNNIDIITNIHMLFLDSRNHITPEQLGWILEFVTRSYSKGSNKRRASLLSFLGSLGSPQAQPNYTQEKLKYEVYKVLRCIHFLMNIDSNNKMLIDKAIGEHVAAMKNTFYRDKFCKAFIELGVKDLSEGNRPMIAIKFLDAICHGILYVDQFQFPLRLQTCTNLKSLLTLLIQSIQSLHKKAVETATPKKLHPEVEVEIYTHRECIMTHLTFLTVLLKEDKRVFTWSEVQTLWEILFVNPDACLFDQESIMYWFKENHNELDEQLRDQIYKEMILKMDPTNMIVTGYLLYQTMISSRYNIGKHRRFNYHFQDFDKIDKSEVEFLWNIILYTLQEDIAEMAISLLLDVYYCEIPSYIKWVNDIEELYVAYRK